MYLEAIHLLLREKPHVRAIDVAVHTGYSRPSVSRALGLLRQAEMIVLDELGYIFLTEKGRELAEKTYERHLVLTELFLSLGVSEKTASEDACKIEHVISDETFNAIKKMKRQAK